MFTAYRFGMKRDVLRLLQTPPHYSFKLQHLGKDLNVKL
jgi:hypothetical protein